MAALDRAARTSAAEDVSLDDPFDADAATDREEPEHPSRVWVLFDAACVPANGIDYRADAEPVRTPTGSVPSVSDDGLARLEDRIAAITAAVVRAVLEDGPTIDSAEANTRPTAGPSIDVPSGWCSVETAARSLETTPNALRKRLARAARRDRSGVRANLSGIEARQIGESWRLRFPPEWRGDGRR